MARDKQKIIVPRPPRKKKGFPLAPRIFKGLLYLVGISSLVLAIWIIYLWFSVNPATLMPKMGPFSPLDGIGTATISPDVISAGEKFPSYTITYTAGAGGIETGGHIEIVYPAEIVAYGSEYTVFVPFFATGSIEWFMDVPVKANAPGGAKLAVSSQTLMRRLRLVAGFYKSLWKKGYPAYTARDLARELARRTITVRKGRIAQGDQVTIVIGGKQPVHAPHYANWTSFVIYVDGDGDGIAMPLVSSPRVITTGRKATAFRVTATSAPKTWELIKLSIAAVDKDGQVDPTYRGTVYIDAPNFAIPGNIIFEASDVGRKTLYTRTPREGVYFISARDPRERRGRSNPIVVEEQGLHLYWGDPHMHTILGAGNDVPEWIFRTARDDHSLDFACVTLDDVTVPFNNHLKFPGIIQSPFTWGIVQRVSNSFNAPGKFAVLNGFEWGNNALGHRNIYYSPDEADSQILAHTPGNIDTVEKLFSALRGHKAIVAPHSTAWRGGEFMGKNYDWGPHDDSCQRLAEIYSSHGASEFYNNPFPIHGKNDVKRFTSPDDEAPASSGAFVRDALAQGYKLGIMAGGDVRFDMDRPDSYPGGLTAVWAPTLTAQDVWNSLYSRRVYGTTGARIFLRWTVANAGPGNELGVDAPVEISLFIVGTAPIAEAQIIRFDNEYKVSHIFTSQSEILRTTWQDDNPPSRGFYYLRVIQQDGQMAWAGPIWVYRR